MIVARVLLDNTSSMRTEAIAISQLGWCGCGIRASTTGERRLLTNVVYEPTSILIQRFGFRRIAIVAGMQDRPRVLLDNTSSMRTEAIAINHLGWCGCWIRAPRNGEKRILGPVVFRNANILIQRFGLNKNEIVAGNRNECMRKWPGPSLIC